MIPQQRSYEATPTPQLEAALSLADEQYWNLQDQLEAVRISRAALQNVIQDRKRNSAGMVYPDPRKEQV